MAAAAFNLLTILTFITKFSGKIPQALQLINALIALFSGEIEAAAPEGGLQLTELTPQESALVQQITDATSAGGTQAMFDLSKLRQLVAFFNKAKDSPLGKILTALFGIAI